MFKLRALLGAATVLSALAFSSAGYAQGGTYPYPVPPLPSASDIDQAGPMQVNTIWVPVVASHWRATPAETYAALRDNFCANVEAGTWILRQAIDQAHGDFWEGVGFYHSHNPGYKADYLRKVLRQTLRLQAQALHQADAKHSVPSGN